MIEQPAINDEAILQMVIDDLQEEYGRTLIQATDEAPDIAGHVVEAMWSEYSHVLSEAAEGRF